MSAHTQSERFFELSLDLLCIADTDGYFKRLSPSFTQTLGWSVEELLARPFLDFVHPVDRAATLRVVETLAAGQPLLHFENRYQCKDGSWKTLSWRCAPHPDGTLYATGRDVTGLKAAEEALRASEVNLAITLDSIGDAVLATDAQRSITRLNRVAEQLTGWTQAEALGRPVEEVFHIINEHTRQPAVIPVNDVLVTGTIHGLANHTVIIARDGTERPIADSAAPIRDKEGRTVGVVLVFRDVTEEKQLEKIQKQLAAIVESSDDAIISKSLEGTITSWNVGAEQMFGYSAREAVGQPMLMLFPPERADEEPQILARLRHGERVDHFETRRVRKDGVTIDVAVTLSPIKDATGAVTGISKIARDITELKRAEERIVQLNETLEQRVRLRTAELERAVAERTLAEETRRASEAKLRKVIDGLGPYMFVGLMTPDGVLIEANAPALAAAGLRPEDVLGKPFEETYWWAYSEPVQQQLRDAIERALAGTPSRYDVQIRAAEGVLIWIDFSLHPLRDEAGRVVFLVPSAVVITERKQMEAALREGEARFRDLIENANDLIQSVRMDGSFLYVNRAWRETLGYSETEVAGLTLKDILHPSSLAHCMKEFQRVVGGEALPRVEAIFLTKGGREIMVEGNSSCQFVDSQPVATRSIFRDITERIKSEKHDRRTQRLESIGTLAGGVAHDLNNALAPILMVCEFMRMEFPDKTEMIDIVEASAKRGADMVRQLLTFAKGVEGERLLIQPLHLLKEMEKIIKGSFPKSIQLRTSYGKNLRTVLGDSTQLHQVLLNLCVNARDAMPDGGTLTLEAENLVADAAYCTSVPDAQPGTYVVWRVTDTGTGIPPEILERIFEPFFSTKGPDKGTGLGLSTVIGIVKSHGGFIRVYSVPGQGTTFTVNLPASDEEAGHTAIVAKSEIGFRGNGETVLVVDDEQGIREVCRRVLTNLNFRVLTASDGTEALIQVADHRTDLRAVITDVHMPYMDGLTLVRLLKRMLPEAGIIVSSGRVEEREEHEFKALGVTALLDKPFTQEKLLAALKSVFVK